MVAVTGRVLFDKSAVAHAHAKKTPVGLYMFNLFKSNFCLSSINVIEASRSMISQEKNTNVDYTRNLSKIKFILGFYL